MGTSGSRQHICCAKSVLSRPPVNFTKEKFSWASSLRGVGVFWELSTLLLSHVPLSTVWLDLRHCHWVSVLHFRRYLSISNRSFPALDTFNSHKGCYIIEASLLLFLLFSKYPYL